MRIRCFVVVLILLSCLQLLVPGVVGAGAPSSATSMTATMVLTSTDSAPLPVSGDSPLLPGLASEAVANATTGVASVAATPEETQKVKVGFYMLSGSKLDFINSSLALDFYIWFTFPGNGSETPQFEFLNAKNYFINKQDEQLPYPGTDINYLCYRVNGIFDQNFDLRNYPFDKFVIKILFEDTSKSYQERVYLPDFKESTLDPMFHILGWNVDKFKVESKIHNYLTTFGTPGKVDKETYSQAEVSIEISRNHFIIFVKMVMPAILFLMISVMSILLPIEQISQKISLCVAAMFSSVAYHLSLSQGLPQISYLTFVDKMMLGNYFAIFVNLVFTILIYLADKNDCPRARDRLMVVSRVIIPALAIYIMSRLVKIGFYG